ncbi:DnaJ like protein subfamily A member 2 [Angomonas deanei]|nr:DnaJ like protein subfamily A member 2 [Angomonas deanei]|eukprot:EPY38181.1 DnaJ like protein subfamily A member 2 [Angomonas deanei]
MVKDTELYTSLGISPDATAQEVRTAYRKLALKYHPDKNPDDPTATEKFKKIAEAYEILGDETKRAQYDQFGKGGGPTAPNFASSGVNPMDIFSTFFGGGGFQKQKEAPPFILVELECSLEELYCGTRKKIEVTRRRPCRRCKGHGTANGKAPPACAMCRGSKVTQTNFGLMQCLRCRGTGKEAPREVCPACRDGLERTPVRLTVDIPVGAEDSDVIRFPKDGDELPGYPHAGDVVVVIVELPHPYYRRLRRGDLIVTNCRVPLACVYDPDFTLPLQLLDGRIIQLQPPPANSGKGRAFHFASKHIFTVEREGMPLKQNPSQKGKLYVPISIDFPEKLTPSQLEQMERVLQYRHNPSPAAVGEKLCTLSDYDGPFYKHKDATPEGNGKPKPQKRSGAKKKRQAEENAFPHPQVHTAQCGAQ